MNPLLLLLFIPMLDLGSCCCCPGPLASIAKSRFIGNIPVSIPLPVVPCMYESHAPCVLLVNSFDFDSGEGCTYPVYVGAHAVHTHEVVTLIEHLAKRAHRTIHSACIHATCLRS